MNLFPQRHPSAQERDRTPLRALVAFSLMAGTALLGLAPAEAGTVIIDRGSLTIQAGTSAAGRSRVYRTDSDRWGYPSDRGYRRRTIDDSTLVNPVIVDSDIRDSTLINPVIIDSRDRRSNTVIIVPSHRHSGYSYGSPYSRPVIRSTCFVHADIRAACR